MDEIEKEEKKEGKASPLSIFRGLDSTSRRFEVEVGSDGKVQIDDASFIEKVHNDSIASKM